MNIVSNIEDRRGIIVVSVDGCAGIKVRKAHFAKRPLEVGEEVDLEAYEGAIASLQFSDAYEAALTSLDHSARTAKELERSLLSKGYVPTVVTAVIEKLKENRWIDDRQLANRIAESNASKPVGIYAMKRKLRGKGISEEDAEAALECFDEDQQRDAAFQAAQKLYRRYCSAPPREARAKLSQALARRGFSWDSVCEAVEKLGIDEDE